MNIVAIDTETCLFRPGLKAPPLVCISWQRPGFSPDIVHAGGVDDKAALELVENWLTSSGTRMTANNVAYDMSVFCAKWPHLIPYVFKAYDEDRVACTKIRQQLLDIAAGCFRGHLQKFHKKIVKPDGAEEMIEGARWIQHNYDLADIGYRATGRRLNKDEWRLRYSEFQNVPLSQWPAGARTYPLEDARMHLDVFLKQEEHVQYIEDQFRQARAAWALQLVQTWGLKTDGASVEKFERETVTALAAIEDGLKEGGLVRKNGKRDTKKAQARMVRVCRELNKPIRLTDGGEDKFKEFTSGMAVAASGKSLSSEATEAEREGFDSLTTGKDVHDYLASSGGISLDNDACEASEDDMLEDYAEFSSLKAMLSKDIPMLKAGIIYPVHTSYGMAKSGRSTSSKPNVQNPKRSNSVFRNGKFKYKLPDVRECWLPREEHIFAQADFSALELHTLAQYCVSMFGTSKLADTLNAGIDPHMDMAANILGISYEEAKSRKKDPDVDNARQTGKVCNFGFPGGLGYKSLVSFARKQYHVILTEERAKELKQLWLDHLPEMRQFFAYINSQIDQETGEGVIQQLFSNRWRGGCFYNAGCNTTFQGLGGDAAKRALYLVVRACYAEPENILYGSRVVLFAHDELVTEVKNDEYASDKAFEQSRLMVLGASEFLPDVLPKAEPSLMTRWSKRAESLFEGCAGCRREKGHDGEAVPHGAHERLIPWRP